MRIVSGIHKGRRLIAPKKLPVRPTTDLAKESLFNILRSRIEFEEISVLDLFAGTGNISYEFGSRGTNEITCVDSHYGCIKYIQKTAEELSLPISTIKADVFKYLDSAKGTFDIIFADPPYNFETNQLIDIVNKCFNNGLLNKDGRVVIEHTKHIDLSEIPHFDEARKYGGSVFSFFS